MTQEEKNKLYKYLCAALPYGLKGKCEIDASYDTSFDIIYQLHKFDAILEGIKEDLLFITPLIEDKDEQEFANEEVADGIDILDFKPYLRPMESMIKEEFDEFNNLLETSFYLFTDIKLLSLAQLEWLLERHFDFMRLIDDDLAIDITK